MVAHSTESDGWNNPSPDEIAHILTSSKVIAMVGLSSKEDRPSNEVARYLQKQGYRVIPVNPRESEILGEKAYPNLASIEVDVDIVDVFRRSEETPAIVRDAIAIGAKYVWLQLDILSEEAGEIAGQAGLAIVMDRCLKREHENLRA
jgi:hypothetical protein